MDLIKQIIYFILFLVIVYLIFFLLTFKSGSKEGKADIKRITDTTQVHKELENIGDSKVAIEETKSATPAVPWVVFGSRRFMREELWGLYEGPMKGDVPSGFGIFKYDNGDVFLGEYTNGLRTGLGYSLFSKGEVKLREYVNGEKNKTYESGDLRFLKKKYKNVKDNISGEYIGPAKNGLPEGLGAFYYEDGRKYYGFYKNGKRDGRGNMVEADGAVIDQIYANGILK